MGIKITFLGTTAVVPTIERNHTSIFLQRNGENILIDCGEGTQRQLRIARINPCSLTRLLITHWHGDHVLGLPGLFQTLALNGYNKTLCIYGPKGTKEYIHELFRFFVPFKKISVNVQEVSGKFLETEDFKISALALSHGDAPCNGYTFEEKDKLRIDKNKLKKLKLSREEKVKLKDLIKGKNITINKKLIKYKDLTYKQTGKKISFIFDTGVCKNANNLAKDSDLAIIDSTYDENETKLAEEYGHLAVKQAGEIARKSKVKKLILTHISQRYENKSAELEKQAKKYFSNVSIAKDFMTLEI
ncbi:MAG: ribonuclease Z [Candidatus Pacearchaeota archaeon]|jgi:ribonuclease Z